MTVPANSQLRPGPWGDGPRKVIDEALRAAREILAGGFKWRDQVRGVYEVVIDTATLPDEYDCPGISNPLAVFILRARVQRGTGVAITSAAVTWNWRGGRLQIVSVPELASTTHYDAVIAVME